MKRLRGLRGLAIIAALGVAMALVGAGCPSSAPVKQPKQALGTCGEDSYCIIAGQTLDAGNVLISNDDTNLYIEVVLTGPEWTFQNVSEAVKIHIGCTATDVPKKPNSTTVPQQSSFTYKSGTSAPAVTNASYYVLTVPLSSISCLNGWQCPDVASSLYVWSHLDVTSTVSGGQTAWGSCDITTAGRGQWYGGPAVYTPQCCEAPPPPEEYVTFTQGGWGTDCHGGNPGCYRDDWFAAAFPDGVTIGGSCTGGKYLKFTSSAAVNAFLPAGGAAKKLTASATDPTTSTAGVFAGQLLAITLTLGFDGTDPSFSPSGELLGAQLVCNTGTSADGHTVQEVVDDANRLIAGCTDVLGLTAAQMNNVLNLLNNNYDNGADNGYVCP